MKYTPYENGLSESGEIGGGGDAYHKAQITTADVPGTGVNVNPDGSTWIWNDTGSGKTYIISRVGETYNGVET